MINASSVPPMPDFQTFLGWKAEALAADPRLLDLSETRIARSLHHLVPREQVDQDEPAPDCLELGRLWLERVRLDRGWNVWFMPCRGVRDALSRYFRAASQRGWRVAIPSDVYPVYRELAEQAGYGPGLFPTFPDFDLRLILRGCSRDGYHHVLLPYPLKLHGRAWTDEEVETAIGWLKKGPGGLHQGHRLILDGVYSFGMPADQNLMKLFATGQVIYLNSLTKGWLREQVFGAVLLPFAERQDFWALAPVLSGHPDRKVARALIRDCPLVPRQVLGEVALRHLGLRTRLLERGLQARAWGERGYLLGVEVEYRQLASRHGILALPASVFGSAEPGWSLVSAL